MLSFEISEYLISFLFVKIVEEHLNKNMTWPKRGDRQRKEKKKNQTSNNNPPKQIVLWPDLATHTSSEPVVALGSQNFIYSFLPSTFFYSSSQDCFSNNFKKGTSWGMLKKERKTALQRQSRAHESFYTPKNKHPRVATAGKNTFWSWDGIYEHPRSRSLHKSQRNCTIRQLCLQ